MGVFKEIPKADGSGITTFYRLDNDKDTVETTSTGGTETMIDYNKALNKPSINNVVLVGNKTLDELGIQPKGDYITEIPSEYITEEELNQKQYATESYVLDKIANIEHFSRQVVDELPLVGKDNVIYLVRKEGAGDDIYNEYIWTGTSYELFGSTATDLSDYYNKDSVNELLDTKVDKQEGKGLSSNDYTNAEKSKLASLENYDDSELRAAIDSLHNYDDTEIRQEIDKLSNESEAMSEKIEDIDKTNDYKLEAVRLIKSGDYWIWKDSADNLIDYFKARDLLGTENCILIMEQLDSDGKSIPADYKIDGDRIRILYKDLENLNHEMYMGPPDKDEVEGTDIIVDNGAEATLFALGGDGKSEQVVTQGYQIFNPNREYPFTENGITFSKNKDGSITLDGVCTVPEGSTGINFKFDTGYSQEIQTNMNGKTYTLHVKTTGKGELSNIGLKYQANSDRLTISNVYTNQEYKKTDIYTKRETDTSLLYFASFIKANIEFKNFTIYMLMYEGEEDASKEFEPYTNGIPSPSPDYEQPINSIEGSLEFACNGKNVFNTSSLATPTKNIGPSSGNIYNLKPNTTYTISTNIVSDPNSQNGIEPMIGIPKNTNAYIFVSSNVDVSSVTSADQGIGTTNNNSRTITTDGTGNIYVGIRSGTTDKLLNLINQGGYVQIEQGSQATEYEPYQSNEVTFDLGEEKLRSVGDVKDELVVDLDTGDYYKVENVGEVVFDGVNKKTYYKHASITSDTKGFYSLGLQNKNKNFSNGYTEGTLCNYFKAVGGTAQSAFDNNTDGLWWEGSSELCYLIIEKTTIEEVNNWFSEHNTIIDYPLATPTTKKLGTLSTEDLAKLSTFDGYNNLFINTNLGYMNIRVTYSTNTNYNENIILGDDSYYYGIVDNKQSLPEGKAKGTLCQTKDTKDFYIYNGEEWVPVDKTASFDLSNYLSKDNTTPYSPSDRYNPATKQYVDTNIQGLKIPTKVSQLENDSNYITENTNTLVNYYNKNNTYNKKEVDALIDSSGLTPVSVTLNGQKTTDANFYAPISGGTANQILISQGDAAPVWQNNTAVQTVNQDIKLVISDTQPEAPSSGFILWVDSTK